MVLAGVVGRDVARNVADFRGLLQMSKLDGLIITAVETDPKEEECSYPSYKDPGRILVVSHGPAPPYPSGQPNVYRFSTEVLGHDGCAFWIQEGEGFDYWLDQVDEMEVPGTYVIEGIIGHYMRGDGWTTDDDVDWEIGVVRPATPEEITTETFKE